MHDVDAGMTIFDQSGQVAPFDAASEQFQVAAKVEYPRKARTQHHIAGGQGAFIKQPFGFRLPQADVAQHGQAVIRPSRRGHERPQCVQRFIPADIDLPQIEQHRLTRFTRGRVDFRSGKLVNVGRIRHLHGGHIVHFILCRTKSRGINHLCPQISIHAKETSVDPSAQPSLWQTSHR